LHLRPYDLKSILVSLGDRQRALKIGTCRLDLADGVE